MKLWKCVYIVQPKSTSDFRVVDYVWSEKNPRQYVSYWHKMFECNIVDFSCEEVEVREGMMINVKIYNLVDKGE